MPTEDDPRPSYSHYAILGVAGIVIATVFAVVASLASRSAGHVQPVPDLPGPVIADTSTSVQPPDVTPAATATTAAVVAPTTKTPPAKATTTTVPASPPNPGSRVPQANFTFRCTGKTCRFDASTSTDSDGTVIYYAWTFGDSTGAEGSRAVNPSHDYQAARTYPVTLLVMDNDGKIGQASKQVQVRG